MASGEFATWINSDDMLCKNALAEHATQTDLDGNTVYLGICVYIDKAGNFLSSHRGRVHSLEDLVRVATVWRSGGQIVQPEVLFPLELALAVGGLNADNHFTMDYELWGSLLLAGAKFQYTEIPFGMFREHPEQKTYEPLRITESLLETAAKLVRLGDSFSEEIKRDLLADLNAYRIKYQKDYWRGTGWLAGIGLPREVVTQVRRLKTFCKRG
jgi:hypothetical protein